MEEATISEAAEVTESAENQAYAALIEEIRKPISAGDPCGEEVRYDEDFLALKTEVDRLNSAATDVDFDRIVELGHAILTNKSKDLTTAGYLALGLMRTKEIEGIAEAVVILDTLIQTFWEQVHPQKPVRRRNALQLVADHFKSWLDIRLESQRPVEEERVPLELALERLKAVQAFTMKELEDMSPAWSSAVKALEETIRRLPEPPPPEPKEVPQEKATASSTTAPASSETSAAPPREALPSTFSSVSEASQVVLKVTSFLREQDRTNPLPYQLLRVLRWGRLTNEPPSENGKTKIPAPPAQRLAFLSGLLDKGSYEQLIEEGENDFQAKTSYLWLGLQRLVVSSAEALGEAYQGVADVVLMETALLMHRLPGLVDLTYSDGTPFVDPMTQEWLNTRVNALLGEGGGGGGAAAPSGGKNDLESQYQEARQKLGTGDLTGALALMQKDSGNDTSEEDRFRRKLYMAVLCVRGNQFEVGRAMLESLDEAVARYTLHAWNPALTLEVWANLYRCYNTLSRTAKPADKPAFSQLANQILDKISRLDAGYALTVLSQT